MQSFSIKQKKARIAPLEPTYKQSPNAGINWKSKFDGWNAILMAVNAKLSESGKVGSL